MLLPSAGLIYTLATWAALSIHSNHPVRQLIITGVLGAITGVPSVAYMLDRQLDRSHEQLQDHSRSEVIAPFDIVNPVSANGSEMLPSVVIPLRKETEEQFSIHYIPPGRVLKNAMFSMPLLVAIVVGSLIALLWLSRKDLQLNHLRRARVATGRHDQYVEDTGQVAYPFVVDRAPSLQEQMDALINSSLPESYVDHSTRASRPEFLSFETKNIIGTAHQPQHWALMLSHSESPPVPERVSSPKDTPYNNSSVGLAINHGYRF